MCIASPEDNVFDFEGVLELKKRKNCLQNASAGSFHESAQSGCGIRKDDRYILFEQSSSSIFFTKHLLGS